MITSRHLWSLAGVISGLLIVTAIHWPWKPHLAKPHYDLHDKNPAIRAAAVRQLYDEHKIIQMLDDENADVRFLAVQRLAESGPDGAMALIPMLADENKMVRVEAARSLRSIGPSAYSAVCAGLQDEDPRIRVGCAKAAPYGKNDKEGGNWPAQMARDLAPFLRNLLNDEDPEVRENAAKALERVNSYR